MAIPLLIGIAAAVVGIGSHLVNKENEEKEAYARRSQAEAEAQRLEAHEKAQRLEAHEKAQRLKHYAENKLRQLLLEHGMDPHLFHMDELAKLVSDNDDYAEAVFLELFDRTQLKQGIDEIDTLLSEIADQINSEGLSSSGHL